MEKSLYTKKNLCLLILTTRTRDNTKKPMLDSTNFKEATIFAYSSGHIEPNNAMNPSLVYDLSIYEYLYFLYATRYNQTMSRVQL